MQAEVKRRKDATQRARSRAQQGQPLGPDERYWWGVALEVSFAYDRTAAYRDDVGAGATTDFSATDFQVGGSATIHVPGGWAFTGRAGYERANTVDLGVFRRCTMLPSTDSSTTGQACTDAHYLRSDPGPEQSGYARAAGAYYPDKDNTPLLSRYVSATELRLNFESLGTSTASLDAHLLVFARGLDVGGGNIRIGIGTTVRTALASPDGASYKRGEIYDYSLFGIVGTTFGGS